jgi:5-methylcytosine-specific restriction endonuclease McrBC regulatory subunit McrC
MTSDETVEPIEILEHKKKFDTKILYDQLSEKDKSILEQLDEQKKITCSYTGGSDSSLQITTNSFIGSFSLSLNDGTDKRRRVNIIPKIFKDRENKWKDFHIFLNYAMVKDFDYFESGLHYYHRSSDSSLLNILHLALILEYEELAKKGLLKSYVIHTENTSSMRGKLLLQHQMLNDAMKKPQFYCEFDELEYDSIENRVILEALTVIERTSDDPHIRMKSMDFAQRLSGVVQKTTVPKLTRQRMMQSYNRQNLRYQHIHKICDQIIDEVGIEDIYSGDTSHVVPVFYDMNLLFEQFIQNLFKNYYPDKKLRVETQFKKKAWDGEGDLGPRKMIPDITIWDGDICKHIIDVKYKIDDISTGDLYQLGFYIHEFSKLNDEEEFDLGIPQDNRDGKIEHAIALTPELPKSKSGKYISRTKKQVFVKRINVNDCLECLKNINDDKSKNKLSDMLKDWIKPEIQSTN